MDKLTNLIRFFPTVLNDRVFELLQKNKNFSVSGGTNFTAKGFVIADILRRAKKLEGLIWIVNTPQEQDIACQALGNWSDLKIYNYASKIASDLQASKLNREKKMKTMELLSLIKSSEKRALVVTYYDLLKTIPALDTLAASIIEIQKGGELDLMRLYENLIAMGYEISEDPYLKKGSYLRSGDVLTIWPVNMDTPVRVDLEFDQVESIESYDQDSMGRDSIEEFEELEIWPVLYEDSKQTMLEAFETDDLIVEDELEILDDFYEEWNAVFDEVYSRNTVMNFVTFNDEEEAHAHLHYLSVIKYRGANDLVNDMKEKIKDGWKTLIFTKGADELKAIFDENKIAYNDDLNQIAYGHFKVFMQEVDRAEVLPHSFQNPELKLLVITDKDFASIKDEKKKHFNQKVFMDFISSLKVGDYVVHADHGIGVFQGLEQRTVDEITREYLKIGYAENDKLFVPIDQADKVNKFIGADENPPKLTRLGSAEWNTITKKIKRETEQIAKELLKLYAERKSAKGMKYKTDTKDQKLFEDKFDYEETPGQLKAIAEVKEDMERNIPMDRLVCGDVGFGKTEVAMRAAFKAVKNGMQVALVSPITILADQHYRSFTKRMEGFDIRVEMLSRFRTPSEQQKIVDKLAKGEVDIIIGTHRLLQKDIKFKKLGLVIVDEEQRFGVKQKEALKELKTEVDFLTLTATPIPRTLNIALNKLRDISTIVTAPPGRMPVITEVRRYSQGLIREAILREIERGGQIYFLHNRVQTIDGIADKLRQLVPEARFGVAHGKLGSGDLEDRIVAFKEHQFDVLVSSTIIENGIDLSNANTLIVNNAEKFGLAQLYQLRGRVGRGKKQAYAYFLYHGQRLKLDAKKRLKAIVEASELGSGFQIAMKDLEIRGAGDILGAKQHGVINVVGVSHFIRMLNKAVEDLKAGRVMREEEPEEVSVELPITAFIPDRYVNNTKEKISIYQRLSGADNQDYLSEIKEELIQEYGALPIEVANLFSVIEMKILAKRAGVVGIKAESVYLTKDKEILLHLSDQVKPENIMSLLEYNQKWVISGNKIKIRMADLGFQWEEELKICLRRLHEKFNGN